MQNGNGRGTSPPASRLAALRMRAAGSAGPVVQFAATGIAALVLLGFGVVQLMRHTGTTEAVRNAKDVATVAGRGIVGPQVTPALLRGDPRALAKMDSVVRAHVLEGPVVRVKIWDARGRIVYSDVHSLIGQRYHLGADEMEALRSGGSDAEVSDLSKPENRFERSHHKLLEVYLGIRAARQPLLYEDYERFSSISASGQRLWTKFLPILIGALLLLQLAQIPLAARLARRLRRGQRERERLLRQAIEASDVERRRIARDLHDGVVQSLAGVSYDLAATAEELRAPGGDGAAEAVERAASETRESIRELRTLLVDIYPASLHQEGLAAALSDVLATVAARGIRTKLDVEPGLGLPEDAERVLFRAGQEALRNVLRHAEARSVTVTVATAPGGRVALEVSDDGKGFGAEGASPEGHFGMRMLDDLARDAGGRLAVESAPGRGTTVRIEVPAS